MLWTNAFTVQTWLLMGSAILMAILGYFGWRRGSVPGARPFAMLMALWALCAAAAAFEQASPSIFAKIFLHKFQFFLSGPLVVFGLVFVLAYARLDRFLIPPVRYLLTAYLLFGSLLILTNDVHHWMWLEFSYNGRVISERSWAYWVLSNSGILLSLVNLPVLAWLFIRSPLHRWAVVLILCGQFAVRMGLIWDTANVSRGVESDFSILAGNVLAIAFAVALFGLGMFDQLPLARRAVVSLMRDGVLVLDPGYRVVHLNPAAERILTRSNASLRGKPVTEALPCCETLSGCAGMPGAAAGRAPAPVEISLGTGADLHQYAINFSPLKDHHDLHYGYLILLHDVSEQKRAQAQLLEQQRALAMLEERDRLARELHDDLGQVLGYVSLQAQAIRKLAADGSSIAPAIDAPLARLAEVAQAAHTELRSAIADLKTGPAPTNALLPSLEQRLDAFQQRYGINTLLHVAPDISDQSFDPVVSVQLLRVVQEALGNARKHGRAGCVEVDIAQIDGLARIAISDNGQGFDVNQVSAGDHYGLVFMRERMAAIGGSLAIHSQPGIGTQVELSVPLHKEPT